MAEVFVDEFESRRVWSGQLPTFTALCKSQTLFAAHGHRCIRSESRHAVKLNSRCVADLEQ